MIDTQTNLITNVNVYTVQLPIINSAQKNYHSKRNVVYKNIYEPQTHSYINENIDQSIIKESEKLLSNLKSPKKSVQNVEPSFITNSKTEIDTNEKEIEIKDMNSEAQN